MWCGNQDNGSSVLDTISKEKLKGTCNSYFCVTPKYHWLMFFSCEILKCTVREEGIVRFYNLKEVNF